MIFDRFKGSPEFKELPGPGPLWSPSKTVKLTVGPDAFFRGDEVSGRESFEFERVVIFLIVLF